MKTFTKEEIAKAINGAPQLVQEALSDDPFLDFVMGLESDYQLHVDTAGIVADLMYELLIGLVNPSEFFAGLQESRIPSATAQQLTKDLNEKVFMPLQKEMRGGTKDPDEPSQLIPPPDRPVLVKNPTPSAPANFIPAAQPLPPQPLQPLVPQMQPAFVQSPVAIPTFVPPAPQPVAVAGPQPQEPEMRTMASDMAFVKSGAVHQDPYAQPAQNHAPQAYATPRPQSAPASIPAPTPRPIPPQAPSALVNPPPAPRTTAPQSENREALHEILKSYGVDPYREPPE